MRLRRVGGTLLVLTALLGAASAAEIATAPPAHAGPVYQVVDADNDPYSGIYLRNNPNNFADATRVSSRYVPYGTSAELICGTWGVSVGQDGDPNRPNYNRRWHQIRVLGGPAQGQVGWMPDRYMNTPNIANKPTPGEMECGAAPPPPPPPPPPSNGGSVYYAPETNNTASGANIHLAYNDWRSDGDCPTGKADNFPNWLAPSNQNVTTLAGWSIGRLGPVYFLHETRNNRARWQEIDYILIFDPGDFGQLVNNTCDKKYNPGWLYAEWLKANSNARLVILAGEMTSPNSHRSIQTAYFNAIRSGGAPRGHVVTCNYGNMNHTTLFMNFRSWVNKAPIDKDHCPNGVWGWNP